LVTSSSELVYRMGKEIVKYDVVVIGGGISGVTAAYHHQKLGLKVALIESSGRLGGVINSEASNYGVLESGPNSMAMTDELRSLVEDIDLSDQLILADDSAKKRYIYLRGAPKLVSPKTILFSGKILSLKSRMRLLTERFRKSDIRNEETLASAIERRLGKEVLQKMINPVVSGIYAGDTSKLEYKSALKKLYSFEKEFGSFTKGFFSSRKKGVKREVSTFSDGLVSLIQGIGNKLDTVFFGDVVCGVSRLNEFHMVETELRNFECKKLIITAPAYVTSKWIEDEELSQKIEAIHYPTLSSFQFVFNKLDVKSPLHSFGVLFPKEEGKSCLGVINYSSIFPSNSNSDHMIFTIFSNKKDISQPDLKSEVLKELQALYQIKGLPVLEKIKVWDKAIPQFEVGYSDLMEELNQYCADRPGLEITGNWRTGVALGDCVYQSVPIKS
jgi:oxygen-dependent protoporphyrinogen oxidase